MSFQVTIPREIIKWIQSLDLSYSVRDTKRDLLNGFLIAEIFSRYYPGKIYMHSLDNSQNQERKKNNWLTLQLFFQKNEIPFKSQDYEKILNDNDFSQLVEFISKVYTFLTQKKIAKPPLATFLQSNKDFFSTASDKNLGTSFILKDKGLEKFEERKNANNINNETKDEKEKENNKLINETNISLDNTKNGASPPKKTNFLRNFNKPISQNPEAGNLSIDVKNINIRPVNLNYSRLKDSQVVEGKNSTPPTGNKSLLNLANVTKDARKGTLENKSAVMVHEELLRAATNPDSVKTATMTQKKDKPIDKTISDALNEIISIRFSIKDYAEELKKVKVKNSTILQAFCDNIDSFSDEFSSSFFEELLRQTDVLIKFVSKDPNELWKYLYFLFMCLKGLGSEGKAFRTLVETIKLFGEKSLEQNAQNVFRNKSMFQQYFLPPLVSLIKSSPRFERKELLLRILYSFSTTDPKSRTELLFSYKSLLKSTTIYLQSLVILLSNEKVLNDENHGIIEEMLKYAKTYLFSSSSNMRTMALALLNRLLDLDFERISPIVEKSIQEFANSDWWESKALAISLFGKSIRGIVESERYQSLVKQNNSTHKSFSLENEQMIQKLHEKIANLAKGIQTASLPPANEHIVRLAFIAIGPILAEDKSLMELFIHLFLLASEETRKWVFYSQNPEEEMLKEDFLVESDRSLRFRVNIRSQDFERYSSNILIYVVEMIKELKNDKQMKFDRLTTEYMDLLVYGFSYTDFKMINMELCENINNSIKEFIFIGLCDDELCERAKTVVNIMMKLMFYSEVKIKDAEKLLGSAICLIYQNNFDICRKNIEEILGILVSDAFENAVDIIKKFLIETLRCIRQKSGEGYLRSTSLGEVLRPVLALSEKEDNGKKEEFEGGLEEKRRENESNLLENSRRSEIEGNEAGEEMDDGEEGDYEEDEEIV